LVWFEEQLKNMAERLPPKMDDNTVIREKGLSEEMRSLRPDLNFVGRTFGSSHMMPIDISCPSGRISYGKSTLEKVYIHMKDKSNRLAR
jgi:hypothetical protein